MADEDDDSEDDEADEDSGRWKLRDEDRGVIGLLVDAVRGLIPKATDGVDLIAVGEVWDALERIERGDEVEVLVELSVGFRRGDRDFQEGLFVCIRVDPDEILLSELNTSYSSDVGSDHFTNRYASLRRDGGFDEVSVNDWLNQLDEVSRADDARLRASRDHA